MTNTYRNHFSRSYENRSICLEPCSGFLADAAVQSEERKIILPKYGIREFLTIIPRARMGSESIAHEAEGRMGY